LQPEWLDVKEGDSVTLSCTSRGRPDVSFSWFKKENIEKSQQMSDSKLTNVKPEDSGEYYCEAKNKHVQPLVNINDLKEGDKLTLKCSVQRCNPAVYQFMWYKNSQPQHETSQTFIISKVTEEDRGSYHCQANNGIKTAKSNSLKVSSTIGTERRTTRPHCQNIRTSLFSLRTQECITVQQPMLSENHDPKTSCYLPAVSMK
uniref:Ig-like domain-containing protein n=1 Tax=Cyprinus carpio TaxID=7962 RepID=A0A8C1XC95_CYPCA